MGRTQDLLSIIRSKPDHLVVRALDELLPRWIPVEERLPEDGVEVLLHYDDGSMEVGKYLGLGAVIAWMPLPEPLEVK